MCTISVQGVCALFFQKCHALERDLAKRNNTQPPHDEDSAANFATTNAKLKLASVRYAALKSASESLLEKHRQASDHQREYFDALLKSNTWLHAAESRLAGIKARAAAGDPTELQVYTI